MDKKVSASRDMKRAEIKTKLVADFFGGLMQRTSPGKAGIETPADLDRVLNIFEGLAEEVLKRSYDDQTKKN